MRPNPLSQLTLPIRSPRLLLRLPRLTDVPALVQLLQDNAVHQWLLHMPYPYHRMDAVRYLRNSRRRRAAGEQLGLQIARRGDGKILGGLGFSEFNWTHRHAILGYWLGRPYWGEGFATEAVRAACRAAFTELNLHRISAYVFHPNPRSMGVLRKVGFRREGRAREAFVMRGRWVDDIEFGLLRSELRDERPK